MQQNDDFDFFHLAVRGPGDDFIEMGVMLRVAANERRIRERYGDSAAAQRRFFGALTESERHAIEAVKSGSATQEQVSAADIGSCKVRALIRTSIKLTAVRRRPSPPPVRVFRRLVRVGTRRVAGQRRRTRVLSRGSPSRPEPEPPLAAVLAGMVSARARVTRVRQGRTIHSLSVDAAAYRF
jgi:hypothetical protein